MSAAKKDVRFSDLEGKLGRRYFTKGDMNALVFARDEVWRRFVSMNYHRLNARDSLGSLLVVRHN